MAFFTSQDYYLRRLRLFGRQLGYSSESKEDHVVWAQELRGTLRQITGMDTMLPTASQPEITEREDKGDYTQERLVITTEPSVQMPVYVLKPKHATGQLPVVLAPHGHGSGGKLAPAGVKANDNLRRAVDEYNYGYGVEMVRQGFIVFCPDARGFGERREPMYQSEEHLLQSSCRELNNMAIPLGQTVIGMWIWDLMRLIDYIATRQDCDLDRLGCLGLSGGGYQTLWLAALDERVQCAAVSGYFYGVGEALLLQNENCSCNYVPGLWKYADMGDVGALIAPRPLLVETGDRDPLNGKSGVDNVRSQLAITRQAYNLFAAEDHLIHHVFSGEHRWDGAQTRDWFRRWLQP